MFAEDYYEDYFQAVQASSSNNNDESLVSSSSSSEFCSPHMKMTMYMDGFHWTSSSSQNKINSNSTSATSVLPCLSYLVPSWFLTDRSSFEGAVVFSFLLALLLEILSAVRGLTQHTFSQRPLLRHVLLTMLYALQSILGSLCMFLSMTFSYEILLSTIAGLMVGNLVLFRYRAFQPARKRLHRIQAQSLHPTTTDSPLEEPLLDTRTAGR